MSEISQFNNEQIASTIPDSPKPTTKVSILKKNSDDLNLIIPHLYLGNITAANNVELLKELNITRVLTIEDNELGFEHFKTLEKYKFKQLSDHPMANILDELEDCLEFIDDAIQNSKNILVHW